MMPENPDTAAELAQLIDNLSDRVRSIPEPSEDEWRALYDSSIGLRNAIDFMSPRQTRKHW